MAKKLRKHKSFLLILTHREYMTGMAISCIINALCLQFLWKWNTESQKGPTWPLRLGGTVSFLLRHWNTDIGCYKSEWQILETTWKPQEIFYPSLIYGNSWWQERKKREFGVQSKCAVSSNVIRIPLLEVNYLLFCRLC